MKKLLFLIISMISLTGCSSHINVNEMAYLRGLAVDGNEITFSCYLDDEILTITSNDVNSAKSTAELALGKEIFTGHTELLILNNCDEKELLEFMLTEWKVPPSCRIATAKNCGNVLKNRDSEVLVGVIKRGEEKKITEKSDIVTTLGNMLNDIPQKLPKLTENGTLK